MSTRLFPFLPPLSCSPVSLSTEGSADRTGRLRSSALVAGIMDFSFQRDSDLSP